MMKLKSILTAAFALATLTSTVESAPANAVDIYGTAGARIIPIALSGYAGEAAAVLKFDLEVAGFEITTADKADYILTGKNDASRVEGRLQRASTKETLLAKAYTGENNRAQTHALADEVIQAVLGLPWIARTKIVYKHEAREGQSEIYISDYDGQNSRPVTQDNTIVAAPAWIPKQWHLFYTSYKSGYPWIYSHNLTSGERRPFAKFAGLNTSAVISPDGTKVAMILSKAGSPDVWVSDINGGSPRRLTETREDESSPCWSPDSRTICFASRLNERRALYTVPAAGGPMTALRTAGVSNPSEPDWSPDGKTIVFTSQMGDFNICTVPAGGGTAQVLASGEDPSWASNSRTVIFTRRSGNKRVLSLLDVPTKRVKDTAQLSGSRSQPSWAK
jgi:TolB protein